MGYETEAWREPPIENGDTRIYSEHGRVLDNTCYRAYWMALDKGEYGGYFLVVKHGGGVERFKIAWNKRIVSALALLDSDNRYYMLHALLSANHDAARAAEEKTAHMYRKAFVDGTLRKRKLPKQGAVKVWIENAPMALS